MGGGGWGGFVLVIREGVGHIPRSRSRDGPCAHFQSLGCVSIFFVNKDERVCVHEGGRGGGCARKVKLGAVGEKCRTPKQNGLCVPINVARETA